MTRIVLTRHGHVEGIDPLRFRGRQDVALTELGQRQAKATARRIASEWTPAAIYSSPLARCLATASAVAAEVHVSVVSCADLADLDYGEWQWRIQSEVERESPTLYAQWHSAPHLVRFPGGESLQDLVARTADVIRMVMQRHENETVVLVGHDSVNRALLLQLLDQPLSAYWRLAQEPCALNEITIEPSGVRVLRVNDWHHLAQ